MAAYLNAAAVAAAQQNRMLLTSPLAAGLHRGGRSPSPNHLLPSPSGNDGSILDFSKKRIVNSDNSDSNDNNSDYDAVNLSNKTENSPLDLSVSRKRNSNEDSPHHTPRKMSRPDYKPVVSPWTSPVQLPYFAAAVAAAGISPKTLNSVDWNGKSKLLGSIPTDATKALEKMSELSRIGGDDMFRSSSNNNSNNNSMSNVGNRESNVSVSGSTGRHSAWQSHWLNKGADSAKDVLKCVWCKQSFPSLAAMTTHMKETKHCGVSVPPQANLHSQSQQSQQQSGGSQGPNHSSKPNASDLNLLIKETMPLPRKLVRGQDVWLGKGAEQTRQILKCMWCGQSFRSLSEMTTHMQQTQHYTNIISQEQIISWKSGTQPNPTGSGGNNSENPGNEKNPNPSATPPSNNNAANAATNSHVSAVLTCKVCDQAFSSLKELSNHMVKNAHYKEHIMRSITETGNRRRQTREKRKKSLPVRKLLELERAQNDFKNGDSPTLSAMNKPLRDLSAGRITCEKCSEKIDTALFVDHIRQCVGNSSVNPTQKLKSALLSNSIIPPDSVSPVITPNSRDGRKSIGDSDMTSPGSIRQRSPVSINSLDLSGKSNKDPSEKSSSSPSVLNAIEQLIEKSFDTRSRHGSTNFSNVNQSATPLGSSILKRLGIDESVDYTKPLVDPQTMTLLRNYHSQHQNYLAQFGHRERSGSESSSISERGSSRVGSLTPDKKYEMMSAQNTPLRATPDMKHDKNDSDDEKPLKIKKEMTDHDMDEDKPNSLKSPSSIPIKKELNEDEDIDRPASKSNASTHKEEDDEDEEDNKPLKLIKSAALSNNRGTPQSSPHPRTSPSTQKSPSPSRATPNEKEKKQSSGVGSLGALSSMFDNLGNTERATNENGQPKRTNAHPLAALQKLCDKTENNPSRANMSGQSTALLSASPSLQQHNNRTGAILAFSWACNEGITGDESNIKCAYCDTTFSSKGAYRHHLSKAHFLNDDALNDPKQNPIKLPPTQQQSPKSPHSPKSNNSGNGNGLALPLLKKSPSPVASQSSTSAHLKNEISTSSNSSSAAFDESPHSKFLKYTELAKQLSSKYV